jgi:hypothetical protein
MADGQKSSTSEPTKPVKDPTSFTKTIAARKKKPVKGPRPPKTGAQGKSK